MAFVVISYFLS
jgi:hypothetical protein